MIELGVNASERYGLTSVPQSPGEDKRIVYPEFSYSGPKGLGLPSEGMMEVGFRKVSETKSIRPDGSEWYECRIEIKCICEVESAEPEKKIGAAEALDTIARALHGEKED